MASEDEEDRRWEAMDDGILGWRLVRLHRVGDFAIAHVEVDIRFVHETIDSSGRARCVELAAIIERGGSAWLVSKMEPLSTA